MKNGLTLKELKDLGFKRSNEYDFILINKTGKVYNLKKNKFVRLRTPGNYLILDEKHISVPKLILSLFKGEKVRRGQITYKDGNKSNLNAENLEYSRLFEPDSKTNIDDSRLLTVFRCYLNLKKSFGLKDKLNKQLYLRHVLEQRQFFDVYSESKHIEIFESYVYDSIYPNIQKTAEKHNKGLRDCQVILTQFLNVLIKDVFQDIKTGKLKILDYER